MCIRDRHVGDGFLYLAASLLPAPFAAAAGAIGAGLADLLSGYGIWAPGTVIIKVLTAFCFTNRREKLVNKRNVLGILPALVLCVGGYYLYEALITGNFTAPALGIPGYLTQVALSKMCIRDRADSASRVFCPSTKKAGRSIWLVCSRSAGR